MAMAFTKVGASVDFLFSGREASQYFSMEAFGSFQTRRGLTFQSHHGKIDLVKTAMHAKPLHFLQEIRTLDLSAYDVVINDFEPVSAWAARLQKIPCIGISHQNCFRYPVPSAACGLLDKLLVHYFAPCEQYIGLHWHHFNQPILPPVINLQSNAAMHVSQSSASVLVYLPFEDLAEIIALLQKLEPQHFVCYHPRQQQAETLGNILLKPLSHDQFLQDLHHCQAVISNAGFELPSEAMMLGKKLLVKPLAGQFEQRSNAQALVKLGLASQMQQLDLQSILRWLDVEPARPVFFPCVATALVEWLMSGHWQQQGSLANLSKKLWSQVAYPSYATIT